MQMALGKLAQASCCWNCAVHTSLVYELTYPRALAIRAHMFAGCLISNHAQHLEFSHPKPEGPEHLLSMCNLKNWFES